MHLTAFSWCSWNVSSSNSEQCSTPIEPCPRGDLMRTVPICIALFQDYSLGYAYILCKSWLARGPHDLLPAGVMLSHGFLRTEGMILLPIFFRRNRKILPPVREGEKSYSHTAYMTRTRPTEGYSPTQTGRKPGLSSNSVIQNDLIQGSQHPH